MPEEANLPTGDFPHVGEMEEIMRNESFPKNAWYALGWSQEARHELTARTVCGIPMVFYRRRDGKPVALHDACWHRLAPLSLGKLIEDDVICPYHGLAFNPDGRCTHMPSQDSINPSACVASYPVADRHGVIWVWPGDAARADPEQIPNMHWLTDSAWAGEGGTFHLKCNYRLVVDNLMDLTHETFVHAGSIGNAAVAEAPFTVSSEGDTATVTRWMLDIDPPPFLAQQLGKPGRCDRWQIINFTGPSTIDIDVGLALTGTGAPEGDRSQGYSGRVINLMTPETENTCFYFWNYRRNVKIADQELTRTLQHGADRVIGQDVVILEAQQKAMDANPGKEFYNLNIDAGAMWARRIQDAMIAKERQPQRSVAV